MQFSIFIATLLALSAQAAPLDAGKRQVGIGASAGGGVNGVGSVDLCANVDINQRPAYCQGSGKTTTKKSGATKTSTKKTATSKPTKGSSGSGGSGSGSNGNGGIGIGISAGGGVSGVGSVDLCANVDINERPAYCQSSTKHSTKHSTKTSSKPKPKTTTHKSSSTHKTTSKKTWGDGKKTTTKHSSHKPSSKKSTAKKTSTKKVEKPTTTVHKPKTTSHKPTTSSKPKPKTTTHKSSSKSSSKKSSSVKPTKTSSHVTKSSSSAKSSASPVQTCTAAASKYANANLDAAQTINAVKEVAADAKELGQLCLNDKCASYLRVCLDADIAFLNAHADILASLGGLSGLGLGGLHL